MHDYVVFHYAIDYCVELILANDNLCENCFNFTLKWFQLISFGEMCFLEENYSFNPNSLAPFFVSSLSPRKGRGQKMGVPPGF